MTLNKHFLNAIYVNHDAKLEKILAHGELALLAKF